MKRKHWIVILIFAVLFLLFCPVRYVKGEKVYGITLPWFYTFENKPSLCGSVDAFLWSYTDCLIRTERIRSNDSGVLSMQYTKEKSIRVLNLFPLWKSQGIYGLAEGEYYTWNKYEEKYLPVPRNERDISTPLFETKVSEIVFEINTGKQDVMIEVRPVGEGNIDLVTLTEKETGETIIMDKDENGIFRKKIEINTDVNIEGDGSKESVVYFINANGVDNEYNKIVIDIVKSNSYCFTYINRYLDEYIYSNDYVTDTDIVREKKLCEILRELEEKGFVEKNTYYTVDSTLYYKADGIDIFLDYGEDGVRPYETEES